MARRLLITVALLYMGLFLLMPLAVVLITALNKGVVFYVHSLMEPNALAAIRLTLLAAAIAVPLNVIFGVAASWAIAKFDFYGKNVLLTLIDLPLSVSPVVSGLV